MGARMKAVILNRAWGRIGKQMRNRSLPSATGRIANRTHFGERVLPVQRRVHHAISHTWAPLVSMLFAGSLAFSGRGLRCNGSRSRRAWTTREVGSRSGAIGSSLSRIVRGRCEGLARVGVRNVHGITGRGLKTKRRTRTGGVASIRSLVPSC